ncbi:hypothetical protein BAS10_18500 [Elizabethkingia meningoseptica]|uniref:hypothetical protein n=1 Tax=Elizabethkingia meningoseptica TaxID=238 RepID=UPI00099B0628|nr:hypothetical protein [Elizabethkingia meningoseptica]OPC01935.1 hypothetical protein BAS10_18500 [Elizabethkingia meningoseptica]
MKEIERIETNVKGEVPDTTKMVITIKNVTNPQRVLDNTKEIMKAVSQYAYTNNWPSDEEWKSILPKWFVESMTEKSIEKIMKTKGQWHYESWIESMYHRAWEWYSSKVEGNTITIVLKMLNLPYIFEQFLYIFYSQGIPMDSITDVDDIYGKTQH